MNRTLKYKLLYVTLLALGGAGAAAIWIIIDLGVAGLLIAGVVFLVPPRIGGYFLRDLYLSRRYCTAGKYDDAIAAGERFLDTLEQQPWRQHLIYLFFGFYTWNTRAMALNNIGAAEMELGRLDAAEARLGEALGLDQDFPLPYYNLAITAAALEDHQRSARMLSRAAELGYERSITDRAISRVGDAYARYQSSPK